MSGRKFQIVKPSPCCGDKRPIGSVYEEATSDRVIEYMSCHCGKLTPLPKPVLAYEFGELRASDESMIVWLPDEADVLEYDALQEISA